MKIAALQYDVLRSVWPAARAAYRFSRQDDADWAAGMDLLWQQMTPAEQRDAETSLTGQDPPI